LVVVVAAGEGGRHTAEALDKGIFEIVRVAKTALRNLPPDFNNDVYL
jgi:actin-like ATPase involved in cell morphogenesis